jgi:hypothetical protein
MTRLKARLVLPPLVALAGIVSFAAWPAAQADRGCTPGKRSSNAAPRSHAYFETLAARPDCLAAYSLRDNAQLAKYTNAPGRPQRVTYDPESDHDPRRQDAAKIVVPAGKVSLGNTVRLPIGTSDGTTTLVTWDAWFGAEFQFAKTNIGNYKTFQFSSPKDRIWFEVRTRFKQDEAAHGKRKAARESGAAKTGKKVKNNKRDAAQTGQPAETAAEKPPAVANTKDESGIIGVVDARGYGGQDKPFGPNVTKSAPLSPEVGSFTIRPATWTRYWVLIEQRANDWDLVSLWVGDEQHDPVQIIDRLQLSVKTSVDQFWLEFNTSSHGKGADLAERVAYARNVAMLRNIDFKDVKALLQRPVK